MKSSLGGLMAISLVVGFASVCLWRPVSAAEVESRRDPGPATEVRQLCTVLNRGLDMLMGANLVMLADMKMSPGLDQEVLSRGRSMMERGKKGIQQVLSAPGMRATPQEDSGDALTMEYVQALAAAMVPVADTLEKVKIQELNPDTTAMQYFNILINQALEMALEGSHLIMPGQTGMSESVDKESIERGRVMLSDARTLIIEIMGSRGMAEMHSRESGETPAMGLTHRLAMETLEVLDLLDGMPEGRGR
jgi:hypothetical protein